MPRRTVSNWITAEAAILAMVLLAALMPDGEDLLIPERRNWAGAVRRWFSPAARRLREVQGAREADAYVQVLTQGDLPSVTTRFNTALLTGPAEGHEEDKPPWATAPYAAAPAGPPMDRPRRAERQPPTLVRERVLPVIRNDLGDYLDRMPGYPEE
jgi:hypothetical protein